MKKEDIKPQHNSMKFEVEEPLKQLEPSIKIILIINMHKTKHKERTLQAGKSERGKKWKKLVRKKKHETNNNN